MDKESLGEGADVSVIIPCYNEQDNVRQCATRVPNMPWDTEIVIVNDGSQDKTFEKAKHIKRSDLTIVT